ncbi:MAG TPA: SHOCT domain-containing protein [Tepidiformaceae bacterium]
MGIFSKDPDKVAAKREKASAKAQEQADQARAKAIKLDDQARAKAMDKGVAIDDAIAVGYTFANAADEFLLVFADRVELVSKGKRTWPHEGAGTETIPMSRISSAECKIDEIWSVLQVHTSGNTLEFKAKQASGPYLREVILQQMSSSASSTEGAAGAPGVDVTEQLRKLGELHQAGIVTDEEFAKKKAELLDRL